jgi:hypothetical protein
VLVGAGYQQDEPVAMAARATNEVSALIALEFHLKLMIPSGGQNLAPHSRWAPAIGMGGKDGGIAPFFLCMLGAGGRGG